MLWRCGNIAGSWLLVNSMIWLKKRYLCSCQVCIYQYQMAFWNLYSMSHVIGYVLVGSFIELCKFAFLFAILVEPCKSLLLTFSWILEICRVACTHSQCALCSRLLWQKYPHTVFVFLQNSMPNAKVGFTKAMSAGWLGVDKKDERGPMVSRKVQYMHHDSSSTTHSK